MDAKNINDRANALDQTNEQNSSKLQTIQALKEAENRKPVALESLRNKLSDLSTSLSEDERAILGQLLGKKKEVEQQKSDDQSVYTKPQQVKLYNDELDKTVFTKPQQVKLYNEELDKAVFTKPQQVKLYNDELDKSVFQENKDVK